MAFRIRRFLCALKLRKSLRCYDPRELTFVPGTSYSNSKVAIPPVLSVIKTAPQGPFVSDFTLSETSAAGAPRDAKGPENRCGSGAASRDFEAPQRSVSPAAPRSLMSTDLARSGNSASFANLAKSGILALSLRGTVENTEAPAARAALAYGTSCQGTASIHLFKRISARNTIGHVNPLSDLGFATSARYSTTSFQNSTSEMGATSLHPTNPAKDPVKPTARRPLAPNEALRVFVVAGEPSGDALGCRLMAALRDEVNRRKGEIWEQVEEGSFQERRSGTVEFQGVGGPWMASQGLSSLFPMTDLSIMGFVELIPRIPLLWYRLRQAVRHVEQSQPHIVITIDSKGFNFRLLKAIRGKDKLRRQGEEAPLCVHYVAPSFWAVKGGERRLRNLSPLMDHLLCILPHEPATCQQHGIPATYVGHPVLETIAEDRSTRQSGEAGRKDVGEWRGEGGSGETKEAEEPGEEGLRGDWGYNVVNGPWWRASGDGRAFRQQHGIPVGPQHITICLLPGSRLQEVSRMLPIFLQSVKILTASEWLRDYLDSQGSGGKLSLVIPTLPRSSEVTVLVQNILHSWLESLKSKNSSWRFPFSLSQSMETDLVVDVAAAVVVPAPEGNTCANRTSKSKTIKTGPHTDALAACDLALCVSGSVVLEVLRSQLPLVVTYKAHWITQFIVKRWASIQFASLPNILLNKPSLPEVLFSECTSHRLSSVIRNLMENFDSCKADQCATAQLLFNALQEPLNRTDGHAPNSREAPTPSKIAAEVVIDRFQ